MTVKATLAVDVSVGACGYAARYPGGMLSQGEFLDAATFLDTVDGLLQNGLPWRVILATPAAEYVSGALWYLAAKHGAEFVERPLPDATDGQLRTANLWRRGMAAANRAARLLLEERS
jgi:hypothetical protein